MATALTHSFVGAAIVYLAPEKYHSTKNYLAASVIAACADLDVISFRLGIPYNSFFGHRGFTHSILVAIILGLLAALVCRDRNASRDQSYWGLAFLFTMCALSHSILDAFTNGGLGVAFFSPFNNHRYFFPVTPIEVCHIGYNFFQPKAWIVLKSEFWTVLAPMSALMFFQWARRHRQNTHSLKAEHN